MFSKRTIGRRQRQREELKAEIREAARAIFIRDGYQSFSMRKLAAEIGYSVAAIYLYFESKEDLFSSIVEESFQRLNESLRVLADERPMHPVLLLKRGLRLYVDWGLNHPNDYQVAFLLPDHARGPYKTHEAFDVLRTMVAESLSLNNGARRNRVETSSQAIWSAVHGITSLLIQRPSFPWQKKESVIRQVIDSAVDGALAGTNNQPSRGGRK